MGTVKKKDKKLVFLSRSVLKCVRESPLTTGTQIANQILELYKKLFSEKADFKNVQRRVYDALNVLDAMDVIRKEKNNIIYNEDNEFVDDSVLPNTAPEKKPRRDKISQEKSQNSFTTVNNSAAPTTTEKQERKLSGEFTNE